MIKIIVTSLLILVQSVYGADKDHQFGSIDEYTSKGIEVKIKELRDSLVLILKVVDGGDLYEKNEIINIEYEPNKHEELYALKDKDIVLKLRYTIKDGVELSNKKHDFHMRILSLIQEHPIDKAISSCTSIYYRTTGMINCIGLASDAWDAELNRVYKALGGNNNTKLKKAQMAWIKYRDAQTEALLEEYSSREGTIWRIHGALDILDLTESQVNLLQAMYSKVAL